MMNQEERIMKIFKLDLNFNIKIILVKGTITVINTAAQGQPNNPANKREIFKNCAPFTNCRINNTQADDANDIGVVMLMQI